MLLGKQLLIENGAGQVIDVETGVVEEELPYYMYIVVIIITQQIRFMPNPKISRLPIVCHVETGIPRDIAIQKLREHFQRLRPDLKQEQIEIEPVKLLIDSPDLRCIFAHTTIGESGCYDFRYVK